MFFVYAKELDALFRKLDKDQDGRVSLSEFQSGLFTQHDHAAPISTSTPARPKPQRSISKVRIRSRSWCCCSGKQIVAKNKPSFAKQSAEKADISVQECDCVVFSANEVNV